VSDLTRSVQELDVLTDSQTLREKVCRRGPQAVKIPGDPAVCARLRPSA